MVLTLDKNDSLSGVLAVLGVTYALIRQRPAAPLSGLPVERSKDQKRFKSLKKGKANRQIKNLGTD